MRLRNIPRAESVLEACKEVVKDPESLRGNWNQTFKKEQPLFKKKDLRQNLALPKVLLP